MHACTCSTQGPAMPQGVTQWSLVTPYCTCQWAWSHHTASACVLPWHRASPCRWQAAAQPPSSLPSKTDTAQPWPTHKCTRHAHNTRPPTWGANSHTPQFGSLVTHCRNKPVRGVLSSRTVPYTSRQYQAAQQPLQQHLSRGQGPPLVRRRQHACMHVNSQRTGRLAPAAAPCPPGMLLQCSSSSSSRRHCPTSPNQSAAACTQATAREPAQGANLGTALRSARRGHARQPVMHAHNSVSTPLLQ